MKTTMTALAWLVTLLLQNPAVTPKVVSSDLQTQAAGMIRNATFMERSPEFTDLYLIRTPDNGRQIVIYCNSSACYRLRTQALHA